MRRTLALVLAALVAAVLLPLSAAPAQAAVLPHTVVGPVITNGADGSARVISCPILERASAGGYVLTASTPWEVEAWDFLVAENRPADDLSGWRVDVQSYQSNVTYSNLRLYVVCAAL